MNARAVGLFVVGFAGVLIVAALMRRPRYGVTTEFVPAGAWEGQSAAGYDAALLDEFFLNDQVP